MMTKGCGCYYGMCDCGPTRTPEQQKAENLRRYIEGRYLTVDEKAEAEKRIGAAIRVIKDLNVSSYRLFTNDLSEKFIKARLDYIKEAKDKEKRTKRREARAKVKLAERRSGVVYLKKKKKS